MPLTDLLGRPSVRARSDSIDALRASLALWVLVVHLAEWGPRSATGSAGFLVWINYWTVRLFQSHGETHPAVLAFIVLSGYCIHRGGARRDGRWSGAGYAIKRFFRIWPVYVLASVFGAVVFHLAFTRHAQLVRALTETSSISPECLAVKLSGIAAFAPGLTRCSYEGNAPLATVMVEMWLYVVYGIVVWLLLGRVRDRSLWLAIAILTVGGILVVRHNPSAYAGWWDNSSLLGFLPYWWIGAAAAGIIRTRPLVIAGIAAACGWLALTIAMSHLSVGAGNGFVVAEVRKLTFAVVVAAAITALDLYVRRLPSILASFGRSGYSLYAFHAPILVVVIAAGAPWWIAVVGAIGATSLIYRLYERPLLIFGRRLAASRFARPHPVETQAATAGAPTSP